LVFCAAPFFVAPVASGLFFGAFFANVDSNILLLLFTVAEAGSTGVDRRFFCQGYVHDGASNMIFLFIIYKQFR
jgi:hypothetical protein